MRMKDKVVIVTGASSGIGEAAARLLASEGAAVVLGARRRDRLEALAADIERAGGRARAVPGDVTDEHHAAAMVDAAQSAFGGLDAAFNNAGTVGDLVPIPEMSVANWCRVLDANLTSAFHAARHQIPALQARGGGSIVFTSTFVGSGIGIPGMGAYAAAKAGLVGLTQVLAAEHGPAGVRINALMPGGTKTEMASDDPATLDYIRGIHALKRMAEPAEIAMAALFLLGEEAAFVTGSALYADGGNTIFKN